MVQARVDVSDLINLIDTRIPRAVTLGMREAASIIQGEAKQVIASVFQEAMDSQDPSAWPAQYTEGVLQAIFSELNVRAFPQGLAVQVDVDLEEIGNLDQLEAAYHYHAKLAGGAATGIVQLPYQGQELAQPDPVIRYAYWAVSVQDSGREDITIDARLTQWANKAPQWLMLRDGTTFDPIIRPTPIEELVTEALAAFGESVVAQFMNAAVYKADNRPVQIGDGITLELKGKGSKYRDVGGRFAKAPFGDYQ